MLKLLLLIESQLHPESRRIRQQVLGESQKTLDVELILSSRAQLHLGECEVLTQLVALSLVGLPVDRSLMKECFIDAIEALPLLGYSGLQTGSEVSGLPLPLFPHIENDRVK